MLVRISQASVCFRAIERKLAFQEKSDPTRHAQVLGLNGFADVELRDRR
jgi:hypothetical protein